MSISKAHDRMIRKVAKSICDVLRDYYVHKGKKMNERRYVILNRYFDGIKPAQATFRGQNYSIPGKLVFRYTIVRSDSLRAEREINTLIDLYDALKALLRECDQEAFWSTSKLADALRDKILPPMERNYKEAWQADLLYTTDLLREKEKLEQSMAEIDAPKPHAEPADSAAGTGPAPTHLLPFGAYTTDIHREVSHMQQQVGMLTGFMLASSPHAHSMFSRPSSPGARSAPGYSIEEGYSDEEFPARRRSASRRRKPRRAFEDAHSRSRSVGRMGTLVPDEWSS